MKAIFHLTVLFALIIPAAASNHYVRAGASGSGADWATACSDFSGACSVSNMVRGDVYYVAGGNYGSVTFSTPDSGNQTITIKGATVADHGTSSGWNNSYSVDKSESGRQAVFSMLVGFGSNYWVFDGNAGPAYPTAANGNDSTYYGFNVAAPNCNSDLQLMDLNPIGSTRTNVTLRYLSFSIPCTNQDVGRGSIANGCAACNNSNILISHVYSSHHQQFINGSNVHDSIYEYLYLESAFSSSTHHGDTILSRETSAGSGLTANDIVRYSVIKDCAGTGGIISLDAPGAYSLGINHWKIYGNVFDNCGGGNGAIGAGGSNAGIANTAVFNNVFANSSSNPLYQCEAPSGCAVSSGNIVENNIAWASDASPTVSTGGPIAMDHNSCASILDACFPGQSSGQNYADTAGTNTFVNPAAHDYRLNMAPVASCSSAAGQTCAGAILPSSVTGFPSTLTDMMGLVFGSSGVWERGALPPVGASAAIPSAPQGLSALVQ